MEFTFQDIEDLISGLVTGLATALQNSGLTEKEIRRLRAHDIFSSLMRVLYKHRQAFVAETRVLFRQGPEQYLKTKRRDFHR